MVLHNTVINGSDIVVNDKPKDAYTLQKASKTELCVTDIETEETDTPEKVELIRFGDGQEVVVKDIAINRSNHPPDDWTN